MQFWTKPEANGLLHYLITIFSRVLKNDTQTLTILRLFQILITSNGVSTSPPEHILDSLIVSEQKVKDLLDHRQKYLVRL